MSFALALRNRRRLVRGLTPVTAIAFSLCLSLPVEDIRRLPRRCESLMRMPASILRGILSYIFWNGFTGPGSHDIQKMVDGSTPVTKVKITLICGSCSGPTIM